MVTVFICIWHCRCYIASDILFFPPHVWVTRSNATATKYIMDFQFHVFQQKWHFWQPNALNSCSTAHPAHITASCILQFSRIAHVCLYFQYTYCTMCAWNTFCEVKIKRCRYFGRNSSLNLNINGEENWCKWRNGIW